MFDPNKHRKTAARLAELKTKVPQQWEILKPKAGDFIQIYGDSIEELDKVTMFEQRNGAGKVQEWLIQGKDEEEGLSNGVLSGRWSHFIDLNDVTHLEVGASGYSGDEKSLLGADLKFKWRPDKYRSLTIQGEVFQLNENPHLCVL